MKKLLKQYGMNSDMQYYEMCVESFVNGQLTQAKDQFKAMRKPDRNKMVTAMVYGNWRQSDDAITRFFFNLSISNMK